MKVEVTSEVVKEQVVQIDLRELVIDYDVERIRLEIHTGGRRPKLVTLHSRDFYPQ